MSDQTEEKRYSDYAKYILNSLGIVSDIEGICSYPSQTAYFTFDRALCEVNLWVDHIRQEQKEKDAKTVETWADDDKTIQPSFTKLAQAIREAD